MSSRRTFIELLVALPAAVTLAQAQMAPNLARQSPMPIAQAAPQPHARVVPMDFIVKFRLRPSLAPYGPFLVGEDGQAYDFEEVMRAVFEMTRDHWILPRK
jgi:hypothetical protein